MKLTSAGANKMIKAWNEDLEGLLKKEEAESRTTYGINEEPLPANYDFARMQQQMDALNQKIAVLRHAVNVFNTTTMLEGFGFTIDEALVRMAMLTKKKQRLAQMKQVPLLVRTSPGYGSNTINQAGEGRTFPAFFVAPPAGRCYTGTKNNQGCTKARKRP